MHQRLLLTFLGLFLMGSATSSTAHRLRAHRSNPFDVIGDTIGDVAGEIGDAAKGAGEAVEHGVETVGGEVSNAGKAVGEHLGIGHKKLMSKINVFRVVMCWGRPNILEHESCYNFMVKHCQEESTGEGYCEKFWNLIKQKCQEGDKSACDKASSLGLEVGSGGAHAHTGDTDGDGVNDAEDAFPGDPKEWQDSDGDGVGDNSDPAPYDPTCSGPTDCTLGVAVPAGAPVQAPSPSPAAAPVPTGIDKTYRALPSQGYNEYDPKEVEHQDLSTMTHDWREEWPRSNMNDDKTTEQICRDHTEHLWCQLYLKDRNRHQALHMVPTSPGEEEEDYHKTKEWPEIRKIKDWPKDVTLPEDRVQLPIDAEEAN